jgi:iron complex transport system substrate-binding protein
MKLKKYILTAGMAFIMGLSLVGCGKSTTNNQNTSTQAPTSVTVTSLNADKEQKSVEVPFKPERAAVLDMAILDMMDNWGLGDNVIGMAKGSTIEYLSDYTNDNTIANLGTLKEVDMEALMASEPDIIFIGGRLSAQYDELSKIAPVVYLGTDYEIGIVESVKNNAAVIASIYGLEEKYASQFASFEARVYDLKEAAADKSAVIGMVTSSNFNTLGNNSRCSLIGNEIGFENLANTVDSTHGNESSFELLTKLDPDYIFVLDRDSAISANGAKLAKEVMENELTMKTSAYQNGNIVYLTPTVWYLAEGGITALDIMLQDLEAVFIQ